MLSRVHEGATSSPNSESLDWLVAKTVARATFALRPHFTETTMNPNEIDLPLSFATSCLRSAVADVTGLLVLAHLANHRLACRCCRGELSCGKED